MSRSPASVLVEPTPSDPIPDLVENVLGASQYISLSYWVGQAADMVCGVNPWVWVAEQFAGDWEVVQKAGVALENLAEFNVEFALGTKSAMEAAAQDWQGNAADGASDYFAKLSEAIKAQEETLRDLSQQFKDMAIGMYETANSLKGLLEMLLDLLIAMGLELAAAAASSWTVVGPILSGAAFAATLTKAMGVWGQAVQAHTLAWNLCQGFVGVVAGYATALRDIDEHALPGTTYDHPGA
ncbi:hypothetical protein [Saccharopolyspora sp. CA-218241]|uniref:hypothetical protein n=1 Tax=Saccharopolyspora sp. CA-218241 TaxID=3240027 RepID=UPI003D995419